MRDPKTKTITLSLSWPKLKVLKDRRQKLTKKIKLASLGLFILIIAAVAASWLTSGTNQKPDPTVGTPLKTQPKTPPKLPRGTPSYSTILPEGKTIQKLGGWTRISPPNKNPVYTYVDKIDNVQINVSEQPLPEAFQGDTTNKIAQLAASYNATDKFTASSNTLVYIGSGGSGQQSVIFTKNQLLVLIKSAAPLSNSQWVAYVSNLK